WNIGRAPLSVWSSRTTLVNPITEPAQIFVKIFGDKSVTPEAAKKRLARKMSVLHYAKDDVGRLQRRLGKVDQTTLDKYLENVNSLEKQIMAAADSANMCGAPPPELTGLPNYKAYDFSVYPTVFKQYMELVVLAFQCDRTRVAVLAEATHAWH